MRRGQITTISAFLLVVALTAIMVLAAPKQCNDGIDNDGDGAVDTADAGCRNPGDNDESNCGDNVCEGGETAASCPADCQVCGNDMTEGSETCDGTDLNGQTCESLGYDGGSLGCAVGCGGYDTSGCYNNACADADGGVNASVASFVNGTFEGTPYTNYDVCVDDSSVTEYFCSGDQQDSTVVSCGNDTSVDVCHNDDVYTNTTDYYCSGGGCGVNFSSTLKESCSLGCSDGACITAVCGNGIREGSEECDGTDLGGQTCSGLGYAFGNLTCTSSCTFNETQCNDAACTDSDGGVVPSVKGTVNWTWYGNNYTYTDHCYNADILNEYSCDGYNLDVDYIDCSTTNQTCMNGVCV